MKSLILESSTEYALLAETGGSELHLAGGPSLSKMLATEIKKFTPPFSRIVLGIGPGSFTGIRVVAAMAQALAYGWKIPLFTASSLTAFAPPAEHFAIAFDAKSGGLYVQIGFDAPRLLKLEEAGIVLETMPLIASPHPDKILQRLPHLRGKQWRETRPNGALLEKYAVLAAHPLTLNY